MSKRKRPQWLLPLALLLSALFWFSFQFSSSSPQPKQVSYSEFLSEVRTGHVAEVGIDEQLLIATLRTEIATKGAAAQISTQRLPGMDETSLLGDLEAQHVTFSGHIAKVSWWSVLLPWVFPVLIFVLISGYGRKLAQAPGPITLGKSRAKIHDQSSEIKISFKDVAGVDEARTELMEVVDFLKQPR